MSAAQLSSTLLELQDMAPEMRAHLERSSAPLIGLSKLFAQAPTLAPQLSAFNIAMSGPSTWRCKMMGFPQAKIDAIAADRFGDAVFNDREKASEVAQLPVDSVAGANFWKKPPQA